MACIIFPTAAQAALQTPLNTFSPTSTPLENTTNGITYVYKPATGVWLASGSTTAGLLPATSAEAILGIFTDVYSSPATSVPKNAVGMNGAAIIPSGTTLQRPAGIAGMLRFNTDITQMEYFDGASWIAF